MKQFLVQIKLLFVSNKYTQIRKEEKPEYLPPQKKNQNKTKRKQKARNRKKKSARSILDTHETTTKRIVICPVIIHVKPVRKS